MSAYPQVHRRRAAPARCMRARQPVDPVHKRGHHKKNLRTLNEGSVIRVRIDKGEKKCLIKQTGEFVLLVQDCKTGRIYLLRRDFILRNLV